MPGLFNRFKKEMLVIKAVKESKDWIVHRKWLIANKVEIAEFPEEIEF